MPSGIFLLKGVTMRYTVKITNNNENYYQLWSNIIQAPVTYLLNEQDWETFYKQEYGNTAYKDWCLGYRRIGDFKDSLKKYNINHEKITKKNFILKFSKKYNKDLLTIVPDVIKPGIYKYKGKLYEILLTTFHKELNSEFIICKLDENLSYLNIGIFFSNEITYCKKIIYN